MKISKCKICKKVFSYRTGYKGIFCSNKCRGESMIRGKFIICKICQKSFWAFPSNHNQSGKFPRKYCSKKCYGLGIRDFNHHNWGGKNVGYAGIHHWLIRRFGKADKCDNSNCNHLSNTYYWAKLKNKSYERKRNNFWMLCAICHKKYDLGHKI